ncbi:MAG: ABC transporter permease [Deltaproteobacteria bacterium]|nr:ABC transporter permease [Deltaproteobacteria bacterium]
MRLRIWTYLFKHGLMNISNNRLTHLISMGTITLTMLLFGSFMLVSYNLNNWIKQWGESISMSVYLTDDIAEKTQQQIEEVIQQFRGAELIGFISKRQAMLQLKEGLGDQAGLLDGLADNPLPSSFEILIKNAKENQIDPKKIKVSLEKMDGVEEVQYSEQWAERFKGLLDILKIVGFIVGAFLGIAVLFITTNTIKLAIYSRRDEIEISKLVGATDWFVKIPFLFEGVIQGIVSSGTAILVLFFVYYLFSVKSVYLFGLPVLDFVFLSQGHALMIIGFGVGLGLVGGFIAVGRFFKV